MPDRGFLWQAQGQPGAYGAGEWHGQPTLGQILDRIETVLERMEKRLDQWEETRKTENK
jgi:hypothetical protein